MKIEYLFMWCVMSIIKHDTHFNNIYSYINSELLKLFKSRSIKLLNHHAVGWLSNFITLQWDILGMKFEILIAGWKSYFFALL